MNRSIKLNSLLAALFLLTACQSSTSNHVASGQQLEIAGDIYLKSPRYEGKVDPINLPVEIKYRPISTSSFRSILAMRVQKGSETKDLRAYTSSLLEVKKTGDKLIARVEYDPSGTGLILNGSDHSARLKTPKGLVGYFEISDDGMIDDRGINWKEGGYVAPKLIGNVFSKADQLVFKIRSKIDSSSGITFVNSVSATLDGLSEWREREVLVLRISGEIKDKSEVLVFPVRGYALMDRATGYIIKYDTGGEISVLEEGIKVHAEMRFKKELDAPLLDVRSLKK
jgi:hypothetical protein